MSRHNLTDREWKSIRGFLPAERAVRPGRPWIPHRQVINRILFVLVTGCSGRDLPPEFGKWNTVFRRLARWTREGLWDRIRKRVLHKLNPKRRISRQIWCIDRSVVRAHRSAAGARKDGRNPEEQALGRSRGGYSTKIHILTDATGILLSVTATAGQKGEAPEFPNVMDKTELSLVRKAQRPKAVAGDKAYSTHAIRDWLRNHGIKDVIPRRSNERRTTRFAKQIYRKRNIVERVIGRLKECRRIATRYDKTKEHYLAMIKIAAIRHLIKAL